MNVNDFKRDYQKFLESTGREKKRKNKNFYKKILLSYIVEYYGLQQYEDTKRKIKRL